ncbi:hypothetical protein PIB30_010104 [Stylosanthes scabra]|uniref:Uncharacterized protein n=1 Tax=Stylosanthes scabra TaxID=79078 RepID=A0ABU6Y5U5_9FABA|nr:hypothetical protein [Stylosanthes scabra]
MKGDVVVVVCSVFASVFGVISAALAFVAELTKTKIKLTKLWLVFLNWNPYRPHRCINITDQKSPASGLALGALLDHIFCCDVVKPGVFMAAAILSLLRVGENSGSPLGSSSHPNQGGTTTVRIIGPVTPTTPIQPKPHPSLIQDFFLFSPANSGNWTRVWDFRGKELDNNFGYPIS